MQSHKIPKARVGDFQMITPNEIIPIYKGSFVIKYKLIEIQVKGLFEFVWSPLPRIIFKAYSQAKREVFREILVTKNLFEIIIDNVKFAHGRFTMIQESNIKGEIYSSAILGDRSIEVDELRFQIPNLRSFHGDEIMFQSKGMLATWSGRLIFENDDYIITIDKRCKYSQFEKELKSKGGYMLLYNGHLKPKNGSISYEIAKEQMFCFSMFLSFLNGRRLSCMFLTGCYKSEIKWTDYAPNLNEPYKYVINWPSQHNVKGFNELWIKFSEIWFRLKEKSFLINAIKWYLEANGSFNSSDTRIIMAQATLELIFNWWIIEQLNILNPGRDIVNLSASNKLRILIAQSKIPYSIPNKYESLIELIRLQENIVDGPDIIVLIRNCLVHSQSTKRQKLNELPENSSFEALSLALWYIELSLLSILEYSEVYCNRVSDTVYVSESEEYVPWVVQLQ